MPSKKFFVAVWEGIKSVAETVWNELKDFFTGLWGGNKKYLYHGSNCYFNISLHRMDSNQNHSHYGIYSNPVVLHSNMGWNQAGIQTVLNVISTIVTTYFNIYKTIITTVFTYQKRW